MPFTYQAFTGRVSSRVPDYMQTFVSLSGCSAGRENFKNLLHCKIYFSNMSHIMIFFIFELYFDLRIRVA